MQHSCGQARVPAGNGLSCGPMLTDQPNWDTVRLSCPALAPYKTLKDYLKRI